MNLRRRALLESAAVATVGSVVASCHPRRAPGTNTTTDSARGELVRDAKGLLDLPEGFSYRVLQRSGDAMSDGYRVPGRPDAMGCFASATSDIVLMRNHEVTQGDRARSPYFPGQSPPAEAYDPEATGGVTRLVLDANTLAVKSSNLVLAGTYWNCAGGLSPWGWLSCEETVDDPHHGFVFLCATDKDRVQAPRRIPGYGRMRHEAAAVDPKTHIAYLTEDRPDACFYRFVPRQRERPFDGTLQALRIVGREGYDTAGQARGLRLPVEWIDIEDVSSADDGMRERARARGAARISRGEGLWLSEDAAYFSATAGGSSGRGQVFRLDLGPEQALEVLADGDGEDSALDMPDNLCVSPHGQIYLAEDGSGENFVRRIGLDGRPRSFARNAISGSEFAGVCFAPDGGTLFLNLQADGLTIAVRGPFERPLPGEAGQGARANPLSHATGAHWLRGARGPGSGLALVALAAFEWRRRRSARGAGER
jgi:secreted PhoX family phosphatase